MSIVKEPISRLDCETVRTACMRDRRTSVRWLIAILVSVLLSVFAWARAIDNFTAAKNAQQDTQINTLEKADVRTQIAIENIDDKLDTIISRQVIRP